MSDERNAILGRNIVAYREAGGITRTELARRLGISRGYIYTLENGVCTPTVFIVYEMARYFGCTIEQLLVGVETHTRRRQMIERQIDDLQRELAQLSEGVST